MPGQYVVITVRDTGTGMPPDVIARAFDPFFTTKPPGKGTGLGLSQVYGFANQSGGTVRIESTVGEGTAVHMYLPRSVAPAAGTDARSRESRSGVQKQTILVVDDDPGVLEATRGMLDDLGYRVKVAQSVEAALAALDGAPIDLAMVDLAMPGSSGIDLVAQLHARKHNLPVLFCSGYPELIATNRERINGASFLHKPYTSRELSAKLNSLLRDVRSRTGAAPI